LRRAIFPITVLAAVAVVLGYVPSFAAARSARPVVLKAKWQQLAVRGLSASPVAFAANDRYLAVLVTLAGLRTRLTLVDEQTDHQTTLSPPACTGTDLMSQSFSGGLHFGGPWLLVGCDLYNLNTHHWRSFRLSPQCVGGCDAVDIGRYWVKIESDGGVVMYPQYSFYLQNISTGKFIPDPARPGGRVFDELNVPSGSSTLCAPLRYPVNAGDPRELPILGTVSFYGRGPRQFAFTSAAAPEVSTWQLRRCHTNLDLHVADENLAGGTGPYGQSSPVASSAAVVVQRTAFAFEGWALPGVRRFTIQWPGVRGCSVAPSIAGLTKRRIYLWVCQRIYSTPLPTTDELMHGHVGAVRP
jgi:hypothetical protein